MALPGEKLFCFRFDIDSERCLRVGVPNLINLGKKLSVKFTFFVSMGRAISLGQHFHRSSNTPSSSEKITMLSARRKLGLRDFIKTAVLNPLIGSAHAEILRDMVEAGHEVGLHGGRNHAIWAGSANQWDRQRLASELSWGKAALEHALPGASKQPLGFASPCWVSSPILSQLLREMGFAYKSDLANLNQENVITDGVSLPEVPVNIFGSPGNVAYIEHKRALGFTDEKTLADFRENLHRLPKLAIAFEHPYFAGIEGLPLVELLVKAAIEEGRRIVTMRELLS